jgi:hypothetical protein
MDVEHLRIQDLFAAEGQELPGQPGGPLAGDQYLFDILPLGVVLRLKFPAGLNDI